MGKYWVFGSILTLACGGNTTITKGEGTGGAGGSSAHSEDAGEGGSRAGREPDGGTSRSSGGDASTGADAQSACAIGNEGCHCYGNKTCNGGLTCASDLCVNLGGPTAAGGAAGQSGSGGTTGAGGTGAGGSRANGGAGNGGAGGAHQCFPDQTICNDDVAGCCLGLLCVSATGAPNDVCTRVCQRDADCSSGCCALLKDGSASVCAPAQYCSGACIPADGSCTSAASACCTGTRCVYDDATTSAATCAGVCDRDGDCVSGCCARLSDGSGSVCSDSSYCAGACLSAGTRPCGLGTPCCPGSYCTSDSQNQICLPLCATNADCVSGCCAVPNGNGVHVCTDPSFCP
ncbi:MAG TPA: hypothetical protein VH062_35265 [Polyangiaceae bacterium]|nr:hypothetical protein [Polyangiaceae bacterium]